MNEEWSIRRIYVRGVHGRHDTIQEDQLIKSDHVKSQNNWVSINICNMIHLFGGSFPIPMSHGKRRDGT